MMHHGSTIDWVFLRAWRLLQVVVTTCLVLGGLPAQAVPTALLKPPIGSLREVFANIGSIRELADGRVLIADAQARRFVVADFARNRVEDLPLVTGTGERPVQFGLHVVALGGDSSLISAVTVGWYGILEGTRLVGTVTDARRQVPGASFFWPVDRQGHYLKINRVTAWTGPTDRPSPVGRLLRFPLFAEGPPDTLTTMLMSWTAEPGNTSGARVDPYQVADRAMIAPDGWVVVVRTSPYRVDWWNQATGWLLGSPITVPVVPLVGAELAAKKERPVTRDPRWVHEYPTTIPRFSTKGTLPSNTLHTAQVLATPDSLVLVRITPTLAFPGTRYDVIDRQGALRHTLVLPVDERIVGFGTGTVYVVQQNSKGEQRLRRHPWP